MSRTAVEFIVYMATNTVNGKRYIGATRRQLEVRRAQHFRDTRAHRDGCRVFNAAIRKYGETSFDWKILEFCDSLQGMMDAEIRLIETLKPEYNITRGGQGVVGVPFTPERCARISKSLTGKKQSDERRAKASADRKLLWSRIIVRGPLTQERLKQVVDYDKKTGVFSFKEATQKNHVPAGSMSGNRESSGCIRIVIDRKKYLAHRLAWLYVYGTWPRQDLRHLNKNRADNRIDNLIESSDAETSAHKRVARTNQAGVKGIRQLDSGRYNARIMHDGVAYYLGIFDNLDAAKEAREKKFNELWNQS